jgi:hypothetical protein
MGASFWRFYRSFLAPASDEMEHSITEWGVGEKGVWGISGAWSFAGFTAWVARLMVELSA